MNKPQLSWLAFTLMALSLPAEAEAPAHCFASYDVRVCHNPRDESIFFDTPQSQVAYNVQVIHIDDDYYVVYHGEPNGKLRSGDSIKVGVIHGRYTFRMPESKHRLWGPLNDTNSLLDSDGIGGGGNPMTISGLPGDPHFYIFFLGVTDDDRKRDHAANDWRHYLLEARTQDFKSFELKTVNGWMGFSEKVRPTELMDAAGKVIRSNTARAIGATQGLIGSISFVNGLYHYFYVDYAPDGKNINLYHRTSPNVATGVWSPAEAILRVNDFAMIRVAKAKNLDRWVVLYGCYVNHVQDICLQYTTSLDVLGAEGVGGLQLTSDYALGLNHSGKPESFAQPDWLTDRWGDLDTIGSDNGGELYWTDMNSSNCAGHPHPYCPVAGGFVYRAGWTISMQP